MYMKSYLNVMAVHLIAIEVSVVAVTVGVVQSDGLLLHVCEDSGLVRHHGRLVQRRLAIHKQQVATDEMAIDLVTRAGQEQLRLGGAFLSTQLLQLDLLAVECLDLVRTYHKDRKRI